MNGRVWFSGFLAVVCLATLWGVWGQRSELAGLRAEHQQLQAQLAAVGDGPAIPAVGELGGPGSTGPQPSLVVTPELLRLRSEVTRLTARRQELAGVRAENERLRAQLASRGTNGPGGFQLPTGYMRRSEARLVGYNTPDDTLQSLLWAVQNHDLTNVLQAFTPEIAEQLRAQVGESPQSIEGFWSKSVGLVGMRIVSREQDASDGSVTVEVEVVPGESGPRPTLRQINGQWKLAEGF
jgi:hypothetical protein